MKELSAATTWFCGARLPVASGRGPGDCSEPVRVRLSAQACRRLADRAGRYDVSPALTLAAAFGEVLAAWSGPADDPVDAVAAGGSFMDAVRRLPDLPPDADLVAPVAFTSPLVIGIPTSTARNDLLAMVETEPRPETVLLHTRAFEDDGGLAVSWDIQSGALPAGVVESMAGAHRRLIDWLASDRSDWDRPVPALLPAAQCAVRERVNDTAGPWSGRLLHEGCLAMARAQPEAPAVLWGSDGLWTYGELVKRALRVAGWLRRAGLQPEQTVAVSVPKGSEQVAAVLGVLAAGGTYVPIGIDQPEARRARIHRTAGIRLVLDADRLATALASSTPLIEVVRGVDDAPAYVLFTSGSTGEPKGVEVSHRAAMNTIDDLTERFRIGPGDRSLGVSALDFDMSVFDIFGLLSTGGAVVLVTEQERRDAQRWAELVRTRGVTIVNCVPPVLEMLLTAGAVTGLGDRLRQVLVGGDWVAVDLPSRLATQVRGCRFASFGGATETAIHSTIYELATELPEGWTSVPYGVPLRNEVCRVVDDCGRDCPDWVAGELWIGGDSVGRGYRGDPARTAERFVAYRGSRWYRTGDLARYRPDGLLEFLGRRDHQVKLRGFRVELGEVEAALAGLPGVDRAMAGVTEPKGGKLVAAAAINTTVTGEELREQLRAVVPAYMVPECIVVMPRLPLTTNGKVDRQTVQRLWADVEPPPSR